MKNYFSFGILLCLTFNGIGQNLTVLDISPISQSLSASNQESITILFDQELDPSTINENTFMVFGKWSGPMEGTFLIFNNDTEVTFSPDRPFFYGEMISVRLTFNIQGTSGDHLTNGFGFNYWIKTKPASLNLEFNTQIPMRLEGEGLIQCYGANAADINDDEYTDLIVVNENSEDIRVLLNDGAGNYDDFILFDMPLSNKPSPNEAADFDHDGKIDLAIGSTQNNKASVFMGNNVDLFDPEIAFNADVGVRGLTVIDINGDGWDDIATANRSANNITILVNDGTGSFNAPIHIETGADGETSIAAADLNNDGFIDLIVGGLNSNTIVSLLNDGLGNFSVFNTTEYNGSPWMLVIGDVNGDGNVDIATADSFGDSVSILFGDGNGNLSFSNEYKVDSFPLAIDLGDIDGDGDLDFVASSYGGATFTLMENNGSGIFINPIIYPAVEAASCSIMHDRNNDGALDITFIDEVADLVILYDNTPILSTEDETKELPVTIYPNPFTDTLYLSRAINTEVKINLYNMLGNLILTKIIANSNIIPVNDYNLKEGLYIVELIYNGNKNRIKVLKSN